MSNIAKISIEKHENKEQFLYDLDKNKTLPEIVKDVCKKSGLPISSVYGLKLIRTKDDPFINTYLSETSYKNVQHSDCLKITFSIEYLLNNMILPHISDVDCSPERDIAYECLLKLAVDSVFIDELVNTENHYKIINSYINIESKNNELLALLMTLCHLFQKGYITNTSENIVDKTIGLVTTSETVEHLKYILSILHKILVQKDPIFLPWKEKFPISDHQAGFYNRFNRLYMGRRRKECTLWHYSANQHDYKTLQRRTKLQLIKQMNLSYNRDIIYRHVISRHDLDKNTEHELYVLQTYILSLYKEALTSEINLNDNNIVTKEEFELCEDDVRRLTVLMEFDENDNYPNKSSSLENLIMCAETERLSLVSIMSDKSQMSSRKSSRQASVSLEYDNLNISYLTLEALRHYKKIHYKIFYQSQIEEKVYEPGIFVTSERLVQMLAKMLHIGKDPPDLRSVFYQPIVFNCSSRTPFFLELFARSMWLLSRTRREMKVSTIEDYPKVFICNERSSEADKNGVRKRPKNFKSLTAEMTETTFDVVLAQWQKEKDEQMDQILKTNPSIKELQEFYIKQNEKYVRENRLNTLKEGAHFPKVFEKKTSGSMFVQLTKNERELQIFDIINVKTNSKDVQQRINIADITHIAVGQNCKHHHLSKSPSLAFSIIINNSQDQVNFIAKDERSACHWVDGFNILTEFNKRSEYYNRELDELVEMDIRLKIIELQNVKIPKNPPIIPPLPDDVKPPIPPKSGTVLRRTRRKR